MNNFNWDDNQSGAAQSVPQQFAGANISVQPLLRLVYMWMGLGLLVTGVVSFVIASDVNLVMGVSNFWLPLVIGQLALVFGLSWAIGRISAPVATALFFVYAALNGLMFGAIFFAYISAGNGYAIANAFFTTAGLFGVMTVVGFTTKVDLSKYSTFFMMALIGLVIAMVVNFFLQSTMVEYIISIAGVLIFTALTAWDTQKIKNLAMLPEYQSYNDSMRKLAVMGALTLYLDFINLFLFLLRLFAGGRD